MLIMIHFGSELFKAILLETIAAWYIHECNTHKKKEKEGSGKEDENGKRRKGRGK